MAAGWRERDTFLEIYLAQGNRNLEKVVSLLQCLILFLRAQISSTFLLPLFLSFFAVLGLVCFAQTFSSCSKWGLLFVAMHTLLREVASLVGERNMHKKHAWPSVVVTAEPQSAGSVAVAHGPSFSGIFQDQGSNLCPLPQQVVSYPPCHQGNLDSISFLSKPFLSHFPSTILSIKSYQITAQIENNWLIQYYINSGKCSLSSICLSQLGKMY